MNLKHPSRNVYPGSSKIIGGDGEENKLTDTITEITYKSIDGITNGELNFHLKMINYFLLEILPTLHLKVKLINLIEIKTQIIPMKVFPQQHFLQIII